MVITYYGLTCFKIQSSEDVLVIDPFGKGTDFSPPRFEAQILIMSDPGASEDFSITGGPLVFNTPGEYEARGVSFVGFQTPESTPFYLEWEGIRLLHLGNLKKKESIEPALEHIDTIDILMISSGGNPSESQKIISAIDPGIIIPMQPGDAKKSSLEAFIKEIGEKPERLDKLTIKKKGLASEGQRLVVLSSP